MTGLFAAVATPLTAEGALDLPNFDRLVRFLVAAGVDGICVGGATGEYPHTTVADRIALVRRAADLLPRDLALLVGVGTPAPSHAPRLGEEAMSAGARALLLPMPMFFRYEQHDLHAYCVEVSRRLRAPCLLYDLPEFTNPLAPETVRTLLEDEEFIVGIKDSSGREGNLKTFADARGDRPWTLLVGDDRLLLAGLEAGWDGGISGVAGCLPELLVGLRRNFDQLQMTEVARLKGLLDQFISRIAVFPAPWGIRVTLSARGLSTGPLPLPLSDRRQQQVLEFTQWFLPWLSRSGLPLINPSS